MLFIIVCGLISITCLTLGLFRLFTPKKKPFILLDTYAEVDTLELPVVYTSTKKRAHYIWSLGFGLLTGDLNPAHVNPLVSKIYQSKLGGLARHGISTLAQCEAEIFKIIGFQNPTEIIARGYDGIKYPNPCPMGTRITYTYTLQEKKLIKKMGSTIVKWFVEAKDKEGKVLVEGTWTIMYSAVQIAPGKQRLYRLMKKMKLFY